MNDNIKAQIEPSKKELKKFVEKYKFLKYYKVSVKAILKEYNKLRREEK